MPSACIVKSVPIARTPRVMQVEGIFDVPPSEKSEERWEVHLPLEERDWNIGLVVGPSGCGKTTIARALWGDRVIQGFDWPKDKSILDGFPRHLSINDIVELLSSVGFSSPPLWLRPFHVLSTGQQMRVTVARLLAEFPDLAVMDEFTSVVDRTVAQVGSAAIAKAVRRRGQKFIAVTCHFDVLEWLQPDWVYRPDSDEFLWRFPGRRPEIHLEVRRCHRSAWEFFKPYHYLSGNLNASAQVFVAFYQDNPVAMVAMSNFSHPHVRGVMRVHRAVCLPDYQGVGIGISLISHVASAYKALGYRVRIVTAHPALNRSFARNPQWKCVQKPGISKFHTGVWTSPSAGRLIASWEYRGAAMDKPTAIQLIGAA